MYEYGTTEQPTNVLIIRKMKKKNRPGVATPATAVKSLYLSYIHCPLYAAMYPADVTSLRVLRTITGLVLPYLGR